jgi:hypothetical protein
MKKLLRKSAGVNKYFLLFIILFFLGGSNNFFCQVEEKNFISKIDSVKRFQGIIPPVEFQYNLDEIFTNPITSQLPAEILFDDNPSTIWLRTELSLSNNANQFGEEKAGTHFTSTLYQQYLKESEFNMVRYVLGMAQTSAAAYLAYRHIKKYGFWK